MLRKWGMLVVMLLLTPVLAFAQNTGKISGRVIDQATGESIPGANVAVVGTTYGSITDVDGNYFILGVPVGSYDVQASFVGYQSETITAYRLARATRASSTSSSAKGTSNSVRSLSSTSARLSRKTPSVRRRSLTPNRS